MLNLNKLNTKLQKIKSKRISTNNLENFSLFDFLRYKHSISKERKILQQIKKCKLIEKEAILVCDANIKHWFKNQTINCRQYYKIEQKAEYTRDKTLYKIGLIKNKPIPPFIQNIKKFFSESIILERFRKNHFFKKIKSSLSQLFSQKIPQKTNTLAINAAKLLIKGYRTIEPQYSSVKYALRSSIPVQYLKNVIAQASFEINSHTFTPSNQRNFSENEKQFRESIRYVPSNMDNKKNTIKHIQQNSKKQLEYTL